jgi:hypothetical protein
MASVLQRLKKSSPINAVFSIDRLPDPGLTMTQAQDRFVEGRIRLPRAGTLLLGGVIVVLVAIVAYALQREVARTSPARIAAPAAPAATATALSAAEESYATALWPIHREVKVAALGMSFAGIVYKTNGQDLDRLEAEVNPLGERFRAALAKAQALAVPESMREVHARYLEALTLYENASEGMVKAAREGRDDRLIEAQDMSFHASENALKVGRVLWPGEYKPH